MLIFSLSPEPRTKCYSAQINPNNRSVFFQQVDSLLSNATDHLLPFYINEAGGDFVNGTQCMVAGSNGWGENHAALSTGTNVRGYSGVLKTIRDGFIRTCGLPGIPHSQLGISRDKIFPFISQLLMHGRLGICIKRYVSPRGSLA
jgi:hypothetical protein